MHRFLPAALLLLLVPFLLPACGGSAGTDEPFTAAPPAPGPINPGGGPPAPVPGPSVVWDANAMLYGRTAAFGSFPSALAQHGSTLFATDADQIEAGGAKILAMDVSGATPVSSSRFVTTTILAAALKDSQGDPVSLATPIGFGYFLNEIHVVDDTLGLALVNAGGSDTLPTLSNLIAFNPTNGTIRAVINLATSYAPGFPLFDSTGAPIVTGAFTQSQAEGVEYVSTSPTTGKIYVAMANIVAGAPSFGSTKYPGTVQVFDVNHALTQPVATSPSTIFQTAGFNPIAVQAIASDVGVGRILVTCAGTTGFDVNFNLVPLTNATVEAYRVSDGQFLGQFILGLAGLSAIRPALGTDATGQRVGFYPSSVNGEVYLLLLEGLYLPTVDATRLGVLRGPANGIPITAASAGGPGGNITGVALSPDGRTLVVTGFGDLFAFPAPEPGRLFLLSLPSDLVVGSGFGASFTPGSTEFASVAGRTLGEIIVRPSGGVGPDVFVNVGGALDGNFAGAGPASLGTLNSGGVIR